MNIGFVSTWFERGAAYVTKAYVSALEEKNNIFIYARGGEQFAKNDPNWDKDYVTWGLQLPGTNINKKHFYNWIKKNNIQTIFFNEQQEFEIVFDLKKDFPNLKIGAYIDYYKENTVELFSIYDFLICNTKRHYSVLSWHPQCFYIPWGTDIKCFKPLEKPEKYSNELVFFHSMGMSSRKGTGILINAFIDGDLYKNSKLVIHTQTNLKKITEYSNKELAEYNIEIIEKTVSAPGIYHYGDVYVYPTTLEGIGLTIFEAMSCGLPIILPDNPPMNEFINEDVGKLVKIEKLYTRSDGYYWPLCISEKQSLIEAMKYYVKNKADIKVHKRNARLFAINNFNWMDRSFEINKIFNESKIRGYNENHSNMYKKLRKDNLAILLFNFIPKNKVGAYLLQKIKSVISK